MRIWLSWVVSLALVQVASTATTHAADELAVPMCAKDVAAGSKCCWPGQSASADGGCVGKPKCPTGTRSSGDVCFLVKKFDSAADASKTYKAACSGGVATTCAVLAKWHARGENVKMSKEKAKTFAQKACDGRLAVSYALLADLYEGEAPSKVLELRVRACDLAYTNQCNNVGVMYDNGRGVEKDHVRAAEFFRRACRGKHARGCLNYGHVLAAGRGVDKSGPASRQAFESACALGEGKGCLNAGLVDYHAKNQASALTWWQKGCELKQGDCCHNAGVVRQHGEGVAKDESASLSFYRKACQFGSGKSCKNLPAVPEAGYPPEEEERVAILERALATCEREHHCKDVKIVRRLLTKDHPDLVKTTIALTERVCDEQKNLDACEITAWAYRSGASVKYDVGKAHPLSVRGCAAGHGASCAAVAYDFQQSDDEADDAGIQAHLEKACDLGETSACEFLAERHQRNDEHEQAFERFKQACVVGEPRGCEYLATYWALGRHGIPKDLDAAFGVAERGCMTQALVARQRLASNCETTVALFLREGVGPFERVREHAKRACKFRRSELAKCRTWKKLQDASKPD